MSLLRAAARTMLASYFVVNGLKAYRHPEAFAEAAAPLADRFLPLANSALPPSVSAYLPEDTTGLVRASGALQLLGGLSLATGIGRRLGAGVLAVTMVPHVLAAAPSKVQGIDREARRSLLTKNVALLGGVLLAAQDTEGKPTLAWRARLQKQVLARETERTRALVARQAKKAAKSAKRTAGKARKSIEGVLS